MSDQDTLFSGKPDQAPQDPLALLVGEGKKYKTPEDLAKAMLHADEFMETLKAENFKYKEQLQSAATIDDVLKRIENSNATGTDKSGQPTPVALTASDVSKIVQEQVRAVELEKSRQANQMKAEKALKELFGDKAQEVLNAQAPTEEQKQVLKNLAQVDPDKFIAIFKPAQPGASQGVGAPAYNPSAVVTRADRENDPECKEYWDKLRRDPKTTSKYWSQDSQTKKHQAAIRNPAKFFGET